MAVFNEVLLSDAVENNRFSAEFFDPGYVFTPAIESTWLPIGRLLEKCEYGLSIAMNSSGHGFPIFRMNEIDGCFALRPSKYADVPKNVFKAYALNENDVLFNRTNSFEFVGRTGIVKDQTDCTFASYLIRLVPDSSRLLPEFLTVYLNTKFGIGQIKRRAMRSINQANVSGSEIRRVLIPLFELPLQQSVADLVNQSYELTAQSSALYFQAQQLLDSELGLNKLSFVKSVGYMAQFSDVEFSLRADAQHYQPQFNILDTHLKTFPNAKIRSLRSLNRRGIQPIYIDNGEIAVVNSQHLGQKHIAYGALEQTSKIYFDHSPEAHIFKNDMLVYSTGAYVGRTNVYLDDAPALASNHVNIIRLIPEIDTAYMGLVMQSVIGQLQTQKYSRGSAQAELYPSDIDKFVVPIIAFEAQKKIGDLVRESLIKQRQSKLLLEQAKSRVEQLIEQAVQS